MTARPVPEDFPALALRPVRELAMRYGVSFKTVGRWRREIGVKLQPGAPKGNANGVGNASRRKSTHGIDGPEQIRACLSCTRPRCRGQCDAVR